LLSSEISFWLAVAMTLLRSGPSSYGAKWMVSQQVNLKSEGIYEIVYRGSGKL